MHVNVHVKRPTGPNQAQTSAIRLAQLAGSIRGTTKRSALKTGMITGPHALPDSRHVSWSAGRCIGLRYVCRIVLVFHVEHFVLADMYVQLYTYIW